MLAVRAAGLELSEEAFGRADLPSLDELFFADHRGVTSLSRCDGLPLMTFVAERIAEAMEGLFRKNRNRTGRNRLIFRGTKTRKS